MNSSTTTVRADTKAGFWNWMPQPTAAPADRAMTAAVARSRNETRMPVAVARLPATTAPRPPSALFTSPTIFSDRTGSTQGIALRIRPPRNARRMKPRKLLGSAFEILTCPGIPLMLAPAANTSSFTGSPASPTSSPSVCSVVIGARHILSSHAW